MAVPKWNDERTAALTTFVGDESPVSQATVADAAEKLLDIQKKLKDIEEIKDTGPSNVTNALFIGSTADLVKAMKHQKNKTDTK